MFWMKQTCIINAEFTGNQPNVQIWFSLLFFCLEWEICLFLSFFNHVSFFCCWPKKYDSMSIFGFDFDLLFWPHVSKTVCGRKCSFSRDGKLSESLSLPLLGTVFTFFHPNWYNVTDDRNSIKANMHFNFRSQCNHRSCKIGLIATVLLMKRLRI